MKPEKLKSWLIARPSGAKRLQLLHDSGMGGHTAIQSWSLEEMSAMDSATDPAALIDAIETAATDHATDSGEAQTYSLQYQASNGTALKTAKHRASPELGEDGKPIVAADAGGVFNAQKMFTELLGHIERQQKTMNLSHSGALLAYEKALAMQQKLIDMLSAKLLDMPEPAPLELSADGVEVMKLKAAAIGKLIEVGPHVLALAMSALARHAGTSPEVAAAATEALTNGVGSA
jgi:hypothetical protein